MSYWGYALLAVPLVLACLWLLRRARLPEGQRGFLTLRQPLAAFIQRRLGGYRHDIVHVDEGLPLVANVPRSTAAEGAVAASADGLSQVASRPVTKRRVAVIGGGLAGIAAATTLAERGYAVSLYEANNYLGGKIGAWEVEQDGVRLPVEHGFHAFFRHYYNLNAYLTKLGVLQTFAAIDDYVIIGPSQEPMGFADVEATPVLNLIALERAGLYRFGEIARTNAVHKMDAFLTYDARRTFEDLDQQSYRQFAEEAELPAGLRKVFTTFSRAFFADEDRLSMAQLIKSFHFYYLSHDCGLLYDYPVDDYRDAVLAPMQRHMEDHGVVIRLGKPVGEIVSPVNESESAEDRFIVEGAEYDDLVIATPAIAADRIMENSPTLAAKLPALAQNLGRLPQGQRYSVLRLWLDKAIRDDIPVFVSTERIVTLDAVAVYERITPWARQWSEDNSGGSVLELHCYAVPDELTNTQLRASLLKEMREHFPELADANIIHEVWQVRDDFSAFHCGSEQHRPSTETASAQVVVAGDWVKLPIPAMLMEAAFSSGLFAANALLRRDGLRQHPIESVPLRGILADLEDFKRRSQGNARNDNAEAPGVVATEAARVEA